MFKSIFIALSLMGTLLASDLPSKKYLNLAAIKTMVAEAEAKRQNVPVTIVIVDENGALLFLETGDGVSMNTEEWAQKKTRHATLYGSPSKDAADQLKSGDPSAALFPELLPRARWPAHQGRRPDDWGHRCRWRQVRSRRGHRPSGNRCPS